ncbi:hypothetical protein LTS18_007338 [Coniosporium uncinatum]|uniref:Uncharacterized protein n=1 Tax=Coniosporium uncinatum TaxID=93489 RepID=A0ACC3D2P1_9PEZI|nr:hypothetical protein LTS18_007338 [Coniosporium uncinatum]
MATVLSSRPFQRSPLLNRLTVVLITELAGFLWRLDEESLVLHRAIRIILGSLTARQWYDDSVMFAEVRAMRPIADSVMQLQGRALEGDQDDRDDEQLSEADRIILQHAYKEEDFASNEEDESEDGEESDEEQSSDIEEDDLGGEHDEEYEGFDDDAHGEDGLREDAQDGSGKDRDDGEGN